MALKRRTIELHGQPVTYYRAGEGPTILLVHGITSRARTWREVMPGLAEHHEVIAPDLLGHWALGQAARRLLARRLRQRPARPALGAGDRPGDRGRPLTRGWGGHAVRLPVPGQARPPGAGRQRRPGQRGRPVSAGGDASLRRVRDPRPVQLADSLCGPDHRLGPRPAGHEGKRNVRGMVEGMESLGDAGKRRAFVHTARSVIDPRGQRVDARDGLYLSREVPTMLMWGEHDRMIPIRHDRMIPIRHGQRAHELMPRSRFEVLAGAGHFSHNHDPERFVAPPREFIAETEPADLDEEKVRKNAPTRSRTELAGTSGQPSSSPPPASACLHTTPESSWGCCSPACAPLRCRAPGPWPPSSRAAPGPSLRTCLRPPCCS